jgi:hypothetical protein
VSDDAPADQLKPRLLALVERAHERQRAFIQGLSDAERVEVGTPERWSAKDHLAHTMFWKEQLAERLRAVARGEVVEERDEGAFQGINERNFAAHRDHPWADVLADDVRIHLELAAAIAALSEADLAEPGRYPWNHAGEPLFTDVLGTPYYHVQEHLAQYLRDRGDLAQARRIHEDWTAEVDQPGMPDLARAIAVYNLACFYALTGDADAAIPRLAVALRLSPGLIEWSKQDTDFAAIRERPEFQAVYAG